MAVAVDDIAAQARQLLPRGAAWASFVGSKLNQLLLAAADELARVFGRVESLQAEMHPATVAELLSEWETDYGLPDCLHGEANTTEERKAALVSKATRPGGQSPQYFIGLAADLGYAPVTITEFHAFRAGDHAGDQVNGINWEFAWRVNAPDATTTDFKVSTSTAGDHLRRWGDDRLECAIKRDKPAHTCVQFVYGG